MRRYTPPPVPGSEITSESAYLRRRDLMRLAAAGGLAMAAPGAFAATPDLAALEAEPGGYDPGEDLTSEEAVTSYNNFYEFGTGKGDPAARSGDFNPRPWSVMIDGLVKKPGEVGLEEMLAFDLEERIYRMRCVEAWSMVIPWIGFPLSTLLAKAEPLGSAKYVAFETIVRAEEMPGQRGAFQPLPWPYVEGLRLDEAMHPLTILSVGLYGKVLPNQNGAPVRLVVPWKYGFKGIKSIVKITLTEEEPPATWNRLAPNEYGFYANVNPEVDHPRWSQAQENRIGGGGFFGSNERPTLMFNGYGDEVAGLYEGMDLKANF